MNVSSLRKFIFAGAVLGSAAFAPLASAQVYITEWMYNGNGGTGEYIEFTNLGATAVDFSGWSFDDDSRNAGTVSLSAFGLVNPGESVILTEAERQRVPFGVEPVERRRRDRQQQHQPRPRR